MTAPDWLDPLLSAVAWDAPDGVDGLVTVHGPTGAVCCSLMRADGRKVVVQVSGLAAPDTARALLDAAADWLLAMPPAAPPVDLGDAARAFAEAVAHFAPRGR